MAACSWRQVYSRDEGPRGVALLSRSHQVHSFFMRGHFAILCSRAQGLCTSHHQRCTDLRTGNDGRECCGSSHCSYPSEDKSGCGPRVNVCRVLRMVGMRRAWRGEQDENRTTTAI